MRIHHNSRGRRRWSASVLLVALLCRAYIPVGFMPASGSPLLLALCPDGLPAMPAHHDHHPGATDHGHFEHCPFGSAPAGGPVSTLVAYVPPLPAFAPVPDAAALPLLPTRWPAAHLPRGPPPPA